MPLVVIVGALAVFVIGQRSLNLWASDSGLRGLAATPDLNSTSRTSLDSGLPITESPPVVAMVTFQNASPAGRDPASPSPPDEPRPKKKQVPETKNPGRGTTRSRRRSAQERSAAAMIQVKPVFLVPQGEAAPTTEQTRRLTEHLARCRDRYREMLRNRDTFTLAPGEVLVYRSPTTLAGLKRSPESGVPRIMGELLNAANSTRFNCPYVYVVVVMDPGGTLAGGEGRPFNGGFNLGGGVVALSSIALDKLPNLQSTLQHQLGHAFGLPHVDAYGHDMKTSASIMSENPSHDTNGMQPSPNPGVLAPEDIQGLVLDRRIFPKLAPLFRDFAPGSILTNVIPFGPMQIDGQTRYEPELKSLSGEWLGSSVNNIVRSPIAPSQGGTYQPNKMWHSKPIADDWASIVVTFPAQFELTAVGIHSQHSGQYCAADGVRVEVDTMDGRFRTVAESMLNEPGSFLILPRPTTAKVWRFSFHSEKKEYVTLRGLQFFTRNGEIYPPTVPSADDVGFFR